MKVQRYSPRETPYAEMIPLPDGQYVRYEDYAVLQAQLEAIGAGGMSMRDAFALDALQGLLANPGGPIQANGMNGWSWCNCTAEDVASLTYSMADAMLKARGS